MFREVKPSPERSSGGLHSFIVSTVNDGLKTVAPGDSVIFAITYQAINKPQDLITANVECRRKGAKKPGCSDFNPCLYWKHRIRL